MLYSIWKSLECFCKKKHEKYDSLVTQKKRFRSESVSTIQRMYTQKCRMTRFFPHKFSKQTRENSAWKNFILMRLKKISQKNEIRIFPAFLFIMFFLKFNILCTKSNNLVTLQKCLSFPSQYIAKNSQIARCWEALAIFLSYKLFGW